MESKSRKRKKIEDILGYRDNRRVFNKIKDDNFVPFIGAGLSAGIGVGSWNELMFAVINTFFEEILEEELDIKNMTISLGAKDEGIVESCFATLEKLEEEEKRQPKDRNYVENRIEIIEKFISDMYLNGDKKVDIQYKLIQKLMESKQNYAAYTVAELLDQIDERRGKVYEILQKKINKNKPREGKWIVEDDKSVYWIANIIKMQNLENVRYKCVTTNFDSIISDACDLDERYIGYLHGNIDMAREQVCFSLTDLKENYRDILVQREKERTIDEVRDGNIREEFCYLFLGTSFSESHIGRVMGSLKSGERHYAILGIEEELDHNKLFEIKKYLRKFGIGESNIIFYWVVNHNHNELVDILHQLSREITHDVWEVWDILDKLYRMDQVSSNVQLFQEGKDVIEWLKNIDSEPVKILNVNVNEEESSGAAKYSKQLLCSDAQELCLFYRDLKKAFQNNWSMCFIPFCFEKSFEDFWQKDIFPIGNTLYIIPEMEGKSENRAYDEFYLELMKRIQREEYECLNCRIIRIMIGVGMWRRYIEDNFLNDKENEYNDRMGTYIIKREIALLLAMKADFKYMVKKVQNTNILKMKSGFQNTIETNESEQKKILNERKDKL